MKPVTVVFLVLLLLGAPLWAQEAGGGAESPVADLPALVPVADLPALEASAPEEAPAADLPALEAPEDAVDLDEAPVVDLEYEIMEMKGQMMALRGEVAYLQETLDAYMNVVVALLEVMRDDAGGLPAEYAEILDAIRGPVIPRPGMTFGLTPRVPEVPEEIRGLPLDVLEGGVAGADGAAMTGGEEGGPGDSDGAAAYTVVAEWGRTPEEAAGLGENVPSLRGMICLVPGGAPEEALTALGCELRSTYDDFDNLNIEVFDDAGAAQAYKETNISDPDHRVLSVSKHKGSGRDTILMMLGGEVTEVPWPGAGESGEAPQEVSGEASDETSSGSNT